MNGTFFKSKARKILSSVPIVFFMAMGIFPNSISYSLATTDTNSGSSLVSTASISNADGLKLLDQKRSRTSGLRPLKTKKAAPGFAKAGSFNMIKQIKNAIAAPNKPSRNGKSKALITEAQQTNLQTLVDTTRGTGSVRVHFNRNNGTPTFIKLKGSKAIPSLAQNIFDLRLSRAAAERFLSDNRGLLKLSDPRGELLLKRERLDEHGTKHFRYQQTYNGIALWGKELMVHLDANDSVYLVQGRYEVTPEGVNTTPVITADEALEQVKRHLGMTGEGITPSRTELVIYTGTDGSRVLTYKVDVTPGMDQRWIYFIDATSNAIVHRIKNIHNEIVVASGIDLNAVTRSFNAWREGGQYYVVDPSTPLPESSYDPINGGPNDVGDTFIVSANNGDGSNLVHVSSNNLTSGWDPAAVSAAHNTRTVYDYYKNTFGRNSMDNNNMNLMVAIHFESNYNNAFWNGTWMVYGDGDDQVFRPLAGALDVAAHEMSHGVIEHTAALIYENQSGALNESFADFFGVMVDRDDWLLGEDITVVSPGHLRDMANPANGLDPQPTKMSEYQNLPNTDDGDNGGVHVNSGIPNRAAYLTANAISRDDTEEIYYRALTTYLQASSQFLDTRRALIQSAEDLFGANSAQVTAVTTAWDEVEVTESGVGGPDSQSPSPTDTISGDDLMIYLYPTDGTHDKPYDPSESYDLWVQTLPSPFTGYDASQDSGPLNSGVTAFYTRPAPFTVGTGTVIFYVGSDNNLYAVFREDTTNHSQITDTGDIWSFTLSPNGRYYAYTTNLANDNNIYVGDLEAVSEKAYPVVPPDYQEPGSSSTNTVLYADALAFDYASNIIVFDALNCVSMPGNLCSEGNGYSYYSIGFLDISDGNFAFPFPNQSPAVDIGYPSFSYNNNYIIALDIVDYSTAGTVTSTVWTYNRETQESNQVASPNLSPSTQDRWGVPSFWGGDDYVTMQRFSSAGGMVYRIPVDSAWAGNESEAQLLNDFDAAMPIMHRASERILTATIQSSTSLLAFGNVNLGLSASLDLTLTNTGNRDINISNIQIADSSVFAHNSTNALLGRGKNMTFGVTFSPGQVGTQTGTITITSDADNPTLSISLSGSGQSAPIDGNGDDDGGGGFGCATSSLQKGEGKTAIFLMGIFVVGLFFRRRTRVH
jgi:Zn-dependent metalloprotease